MSDTWDLVEVVKWAQSCEDVEAVRAKSIELGGYLNDVEDAWRAVDNRADELEDESV